MASGTSAPVKRNSFHKLSHILPSFSRPSFDSARLRTSRKSSSTKMDVARSPPAYSPTFASSDGRGSFNPTASVTSAANSCLSSPQSPLLAHPIASSDYELPIPPTTNALASEEKMKLIRKARKLSRVLGEVPVASALDREDPSFDTSPRLSDVQESPFISSKSASPVPSSSNKIQTVSTSAKKAFRRSLTFVQSGSSSSLQVHDVQRSKSFSTLRPSLQVPSTSSLCSDVPYSPILFATSVQGTTSETSVLASSSPSSRQAPAEEHFDDSFRRNSSSSSLCSIDITEQPVPSPEQLQRQRMAKLTRHLGDNIPPEVLLRASSPPVAQVQIQARGSQLSLYSIRNPHTVLSADNLPRRTEGFAAMATLRKRPISMEFSGHRKSGALSAPVTPLASPNSVSTDFDTVRRRKTSRTTVSGDAQVMQDSDTREDFALDSSEPMTEKQRMLNVKRAKKMTQVRTYLSFTYCIAYAILVVRRQPTNSSVPDHELRAKVSGLFFSSDGTLR